MERKKYLCKDFVLAKYKIIICLGRYRSSIPNTGHELNCVDPAWYQFSWGVWRFECNNDCDDDSDRVNISRYFGGKSTVKIRAGIYYQQSVAGGGRQYLTVCTNLLTIEWAPNWQDQSPNRASFDIILSFVGRYWCRQLTEVNYSLDFYLKDG